MGGMDTFKNNDSVYSHGEESLAMLDELAKATKECAFKGTILVSNVSIDSARFVFQHIRESIEAYRDLTEEIDDDLRECRAAYEHDKELEQEREKSNQLEKELSRLKDRCSALVIDRDSVVEYWTKHCESLLQKHREELAAKDREIYETRLQSDKNSDSATYWKCKCHKLEKARINNPCNFCGNCKYFAFIVKEDGMHGCCHVHHLKEVDPDDASCDKFCNPCEKPDHEVCDNCDSDCDTCGYYPF